MTYKQAPQDSDAVAIRITDGAFIPADPLNPDYRGYLAWLDAGNSPAPTDPQAPPEAVSDRQFFQQIAILRLITEEEAEEAVGAGVIPAPMLALVNQLPEAMRFDARMKLRGATVFNRSSPLTAMLAQAYGWTQEKVDDLWSSAANL